MRLLTLHGQATYCSAMQLPAVLRERLEQQIVTTRKVDLFENTEQRGNEKKSQGRHRPILCMQSLKGNRCEKNESLKLPNWHEVRRFPKGAHFDMWDKKTSTTPPGVLM